MKIFNIIKKVFLERNVLSFAGNFLFAAFGFVSFLILTRSMGKAEFGEYVLFITAGAFVDLFRIGLTRSAVVRFLSGSDINERLKLLGSNSLIGLIQVLIVSILLYLILLVAHNPISKSGFESFFIWYPLLALANLFWNDALTVLQADQAFGRSLVLRMSNVISFTLFLIANYFWWHFNVTIIILANIGTNLLSSIIAIALNWEGVRYLKFANKKDISTILHFGKYSVGTMIGSSLLKSADTFLIGLAPFLGSVGVAKYVIPLKLTELIEIPLRSFMATAFPKLSKASMEKNYEYWKSVFYTYSGAITLMFIPFVIFLFIFAEQFVLILGGEQYADSIAELSAVFRLFAVYGLILPLDRSTGIALDSINKPQNNLLKVVLMASLNVIGDLLAIYWLHSIFWVAFSTILNTLLGVYLGFYFLQKEINLEYRQLFIRGNLFYKDLFPKIKAVIFGKK